MSAWAVGQVRKIEKRGLIIFTAEELSSQWLQVYCNVVQLPYNLSKNYRYNPSLDWYGNYTIMVNNAYAIEGKHICFENQLIFEYRRSLEQAQENIYSYLQSMIEFFENISLRVAIPVIYKFFTIDNIELPLIPYGILKFVLAEGCIIEITCKYIPFEKRVNTPTIDEIPDPPDLPPSPPNLPPGDSDPPTSSPPGEDGQHIISPPYNAPDDNGDTYVPPSLNEPPDNPTDYNGLAWKVIVNIKYFTSSGSVFNGLPSQNYEAIIYGKYLKTEVFTDNNYNIKGTRIKYQRLISNSPEYTNVGGQTTDLSVVIKYKVISITRA